MAMVPLPFTEIYSPYLILIKFLVCSSNLRISFHLMSYGQINNCLINQLSVKLRHVKQVAILALKLQLFLLVSLVALDVRSSQIFERRVTFFPYSRQGEQLSFSLFENLFLFSPCIFLFSFCMYHQSSYCLTIRVPSIAPSCVITRHCCCS